MGLLASAIIEKKASSTLDLFKEIYGGRGTKSGKTVNIETAIQVSTVFACNRVIGNGIAQVPLKLMLEKDGKRLPAKNHRLYNLMAYRPNRWQTSFEWRQMMSWHVELAGNHCSFINRIGGQVIELYPFTPSQVKVLNRGGGVLEYEVTAEDGSKKIFPAEAILHIRGPSWNGVTGLEVVKVAREAIGLAIATEESAASLHKNGIQASGTYSVEGTLTDTQHKGLSEWIQKHNAGSENAGRPLILDRAAKWLGTQMTGIDAQALETRMYQIAEICRFHGVQPIMAGYSDKAATFASAEAFMQSHITDCLSPRWQAYEQVFFNSLLTEKEREEGYYFNFVEEGMIRGSIKDTKDALLGYTNGGLMTPNEARAKLDLNPDPDPASNQLRIPANIVGTLPAGDA
jgi:HK97 family phage portal protein